MAEVLGVVASGISIAGLAIQIASSIQQILDFWSSIKGAPTDLQNLLEELGLLAEILSTVDDDTDNDETSPRQNAAVKAARYCQNAASCIEAVVRDLSEGLAVPRGRRHWTAIKTVLKDKKMSKCLQRLERAKTMLSLAQQCYTQSQITALKEFQRQKFQAIEDLYAAPTSQYNVTTITECGNSRSRSPNVAAIIGIRDTHIRDKPAEDVTYWLPLGTLTVRSRQSGQNEVDAEQGDVKHKDFEFRPRPWIFRRGFSIFSTQLYGLWQYSFRSYRIITMADPIYAACVEGDLGRVQRLCSQCRASPFDRTSDGWTLLHVAAALADAKLCRWLIGQGLDGNVCGRLDGAYPIGDGTMSDIRQIYPSGSTPLHVAANCSGRLLHYIPEQLDSYLDCIKASHHRDILDNSRYQKDVLDTFRVLIEEGQSDPTVTDAAGASALHACTGTWDDFHYLVNQEHCHVDVTQRSDDGVSLAQHHANWGWPTSARIADYAFEQERLSDANFPSIQNPGRPPRSSRISLLHGAVRLMEQHYDGTEFSVRYAINLIRQLITSGIDLHGLKNWTRHLPNFAATESSAIDVIMQPVEWIVSEGSEAMQLKVAAKTIPCFRLWLKTLSDAHVDVKKYLHEEERLASHKRERNMWYPGGIGNFRYEYRVDWHVSPSEDDQEYSISIEYTSREKAKPISDFNAPGGWVDDE
ncbi:hypothetical protein MMC11_002862 [Xylographa trunciseda]|nr:hypothetical protein [Xylographa trunciseda]